MEKINLVEILRDCPKGTKLYSPLFGEVEFIEINDNHYEHPIVIKTKRNLHNDFAADGRYYYDYHNAECLLFPSKDQKDWTKFKCSKHKFNPKLLKPFDKVLIKANALSTWTADLFSCIDGEGVMCTGGYFIEVIPYNEETKYLIGTRAEAPEYYKWWKV